MTARTTLQQLQDRDQMLSAQNEMLKVDKTNLKRRVAELDEMVRTILGTPKTQQQQPPIHRTSKTKACFSPRKWVLYGNGNFQLTCHGFSWSSRTIARWSCMRLISPGDWNTPRSIFLAWMVNLLNTSNLAAAVAPVVDIQETSVSDTRRKQTIGECFAVQQKLILLLSFFNLVKSIMLLANRKQKNWVWMKSNAAEFTSSVKVHIFGQLVVNLKVNIEKERKTQILVMCDHNFLLDYKFTF